MTSTCLHNLPLWKMTLVVFGATFLVGTATHIVTSWLADGQHRRLFIAVSARLAVSHRCHLWPAMKSIIRYVAQLRGKIVDQRAHPGWQEAVRRIQQPDRSHIGARVELPVDENLHKVTLP
ncbi:hypothetical protein BX592_1334 [Paraburkholderia rhizosphaerae]|uniref:Uncharacterized protein n=1 Tax=Paraburkholderia rhizosphaerae TaxID=480658 RepID=A0A4R8L6G7_9BURK|nr:hypothetical protein BX592_1334 [Paraburkholderia rhizosphaerae]